MMLHYSFCLGDSDEEQEEEEEEAEKERSQNRKRKRAEKTTTKDKDATTSSSRQESKEKQTKLNQHRSTEEEREVSSLSPSESFEGTSYTQPGLCPSYRWRNSDGIEEWIASVTTTIERKEKEETVTLQEIQGGPTDIFYPEDADKDSSNNYNNHNTTNIKDNKNPTTTREEQAGIQEVLAVKKTTMVSYAFVPRPEGGGGKWVRRTRTWTCVSKEVFLLED